jgi:enediyne biosynthesis protein E4
MCLQHGDSKGPIREVHAGSGYWSQDSAVQVLSIAGQPTTLWVRWPGGKITTANLPPAAKEIQIDKSAEIKAVR